MRKRSAFLLGLFFVLPVAGVVWALIWIINFGKGLAPTIRPLVPFLPQSTSPQLEKFISIALGLLVLAIACCIIYLVGLLLQRKIAATFLNRMRDLLVYVPGLGRIYTLVKGVVENIPEDPKKAFGEPVLVYYPGTHILVIGFKTGETRDRIGVVFPGIPPCTPYFFLRKHVRRIPNVSIEEALQAVVSSGMSLPHDVVEAIDHADITDKAVN